MFYFIITGKTQFCLSESAYMNVPIISSDCDNGPKEILDYGKNGILFRSNDKASLLDAHKI